MNPKYERLIDGTDYRTMESYLRNRSDPIDYIVHVRDPKALSDVAAILDTAVASGKARPEDIRDLLLPFVEREEILLTSRRPILLPVGALVGPGRISDETFCKVICLPPFYVSHTEGLFEAHRANRAKEIRQSPDHSIHRTRIKL